MSATSNPSKPGLLAELAGPAEIIRQFTPNWFAVTMGTGIVAIVLAQFPQLPLLFGIGQALWLLNIALFALFSVLYGARWVLHFEGARRILDHPGMSMFLGCIPMGSAPSSMDSWSSASRRSATRQFTSPSGCGGSTPPWRWPAGLACRS